MAEPSPSCTTFPLRRPPFLTRSLTFIYSTTWRLCFYINLPLGGLAALGLIFTHIPDKRTEKEIPPLHTFARKLDLVGFLIFAPAAISKSPFCMYMFPRDSLTRASQCSSWPFSTAAVSSPGIAVKSLACLSALPPLWPSLVSASSASSFLRARMLTKTSILGAQSGRRRHAAAFHV